MPLVVVPIDLDCPRCESRVAKLELELPAGEIEPPSVRIGVTLRCSHCPQSVIFGELAGEVTADAPAHE